MNWWVCNGSLIARNRSGRLTLLGERPERKEWREANKFLLELDEADRVVMTSTSTRLAQCQSGTIYRWNSKGFRVCADELLICPQSEFVRKTLDVKFSHDTGFMRTDVVFKWSDVDRKAEFKQRSIVGDYLKSRMRQVGIRRWSKTLDVVDYSRKHGYILAANGRAYNVFRHYGKLKYQKIQMARLPRKSARC